jgi:5-formyltetrahydrofolate cyclo-ligase
MTKAAVGQAAKAALRADAMARRNAMSADARASGAAVIVTGAISLLAPLRPGVVAAYRAIRTEVVPDPVVEWAVERGIAVVLPAVVDATTMVFRRYRPGDELVAGGLGTFAPSPSAPVIDPDVIVLPMVGFDRTGVRLGHGAGFYDRAVWALRARGVSPKLIGLAFAAQELAAIPAASHDISMDWIVTERETIDFRHIG